MIKWLSGKDNDNYEFESENKLLSEKWHSFSGYSDLEKIKSNMITVKIFIEAQSNLEYYFPESEFNYLIQKSTPLINSTRLKKNLRQGIPIKYTRTIILNMFNVDSSTLKENYKTRFISIFKNRDPKNIGNHVPYLSYFNTFEENLPICYLTDNGVQTTKELIWLLYSVAPNIKFCPLLLKIIALSLVFLTKEECFSYIKQIIINDYSIKKLSSLRFRLRFNYEENKKLIPAFIQSFKSITSHTGKDIITKFEKIGFDAESLIEDMFFNIFLGYLNFGFIHRTFVLYLNEGCKIFFRVAYAILKILRSDLLNISKPENVIPFIKSKSFELKDDVYFFNLAFTFKLNRKNNKYEESKILENFKIRNDNFYIPTISGESSIMIDDDIFQLWNIFPENFKTKDAKLIFSTEYYGFSLSKIYEVSMDSENSCFNSFFIISTKLGNVFGVIMSLPLDKNRTGFYKPSYTCLFELKPKSIRYDVVSNSDRIILCGEDKLIIGLGKNGPALEIYEDLLVGFSYKSEIFDSPSLVMNDKENDFSFEISKLEVYILY